ncbi:MAG TPA: hypothetical protein VIG74_00420 [Alphaproteobacteria bacterium]|jgi:uncharacterized membrane protein
MTDTGQERKSVLKIYTAMGGMMALSLIPHVAAAIAVAFLFTGILIAARSIRKKSTPGGMAESHMTYTIRTIWISSFIGMISTALASVYVLKYYDPSIIHQCAEEIMNGAQNVDACIAEFIAVNYNTFMIGAIMAGVPVGVYFIYRFFRGLAPALQGQPIRNPKIWL